MNTQEIKEKISMINNMIMGISVSERSDSPDAQEIIRGLKKQIEDLEDRLPVGHELKPIPGDGTLQSRSLGSFKSKFSSLGEQLQVIARSSIAGNPVDQRLYDQRAISGMGEMVPSSGGFLLDSSFSNDLLSNVYTGSQFLDRCKKISIQSNSIKLPKIYQTSRADGSRFGGVRGYWVAEGGSITDSKPKFELQEHVPAKVCVLTYVTDELLADAKSLELVVRQAMIEELRFKIEDAIINGDGAGKPLGILNSSCLVTQTAETGQSSGVLYENVLKMWSRLPGPNMANSVWLVNQDVLPEIYSMSLVIGTGGAPVYMPSNGVQGPYATLFGRPVIPIEQCATNSTIGDVVLCDLSQYLLVDCGAIQNASSIHVLFDTDQSVLRSIYRISGAPIWSSAITPFKGSNSISPFVALATRS